MTLNRNDDIFGFYGCQGIFEDFEWEMKQDVHYCLGKLVGNTNLKWT